MHKLSTKKREKRGNVAYVQFSTATDYCMRKRRVLDAHYRCVAKTADMGARRATKTESPNDRIIV